MRIEDHDLAVFACRPVDIFLIPLEYRQDLKPRLASDTVEECHYCRGPICVSEAARNEREHIHAKVGRSVPVVMACWPCLINGVRIHESASDTMANYHLTADNSGFEPTLPDHKIQITAQSGEVKMIAKQAPELPTGMYL